MKEFIEELKYNQNINKKNKLDNKIDIEYVIERLETIQKYLVNNIDYFKFDEKNLNETQKVKIFNIINNLKNKGAFKD